MHDIPRVVPPETAQRHAISAANGPDIFAHLLFSPDVTLRKQYSGSLAVRGAADKEAMMIDLTPFQADLEKICQELSLQQLDLIGSAAREDFTTESDIDVLVTFAGDENLLERFFSLKFRLEGIFKREVDIIEERAMRNPFFKKAVNKDRVRVYGT